MASERCKNLQSEGFIFEYKFPERLLPKWEMLSDAQQFRYIMLTDTENLYVIFQFSSRALSSFRKI